MHDQSRGPLRALHVNGESVGNIRRSTFSLLLNNESDSHSTPLPRTRRQTRQSLTRSKMPCETDDLLKCAPSAEDIRYHFPIRLSSTRSEKLLTTLMRNDSNLGKRSANEEVIKDQRKSTRVSLDHIHPNNIPQLTMGAYVKAHPRYGRRQSSQDTLFMNDHRRLSPICPVPMPDGFPTKFPITYNPVPFPWELQPCQTVSSPVLQCSIETQTSPVKLSSENCSTQSMDKKQSARSKRLSFGSANLLVGIRKSFGHLRRAISADRLSRIGQTPTNKSPPTPSKMLVNREGNKHDLLSRSRTRHSVTGCTRVNESEQSLCVNQQASLGDFRDEQGLTCRLVKRYSDGTVKVALRRLTTQQQFGFFIAKDSQGIYISRLGNVRCVVKFWNIFRVGDRILEVQGHPCNSLDVEDVRNLIRDCEMVEFRIQPARSGSLRQKR